MTSRPMHKQYAREIEALKLLHPNWRDLSASDQQAFHHTFMFTIEAAVKAGVVKWPSDEREPK